MLLTGFGSTALVLVIAALVGLAIHAVLYRSISALGRRIPEILIFDGLLIHRSRAPARLLFPLLTVRWALRWAELDLPPGTSEVVFDVLYVLLVGTMAWLFIALSGLLEDIVERRFEIGTENNLQARRVRTQTILFRRVLMVGVGLFSLGAVLFRFEGFRAIGTGLLASAGVAGVVIGIAAQRPLSNLLAGIQIALTQPIRVDDVVVVEGEMGRVEEITLTYVVIRIWDQRRLVLPISHFIEEPFQNWTRTSAEILTTAHLYLDYTAPVEAIREEAARIVERSPYWDGRVFRVHVTDTTERCIELRLLMSAADAGKAWELRCELREELIAFLQRELPGALPRVRTDIEPALRRAADLAAPSVNESREGRGRYGG